MVMNRVEIHELLACACACRVCVPPPITLINPSFESIFRLYYPALPLAHEPLDATMHTMARRMLQRPFHDTLNGLAFIF